MFYETHTRMETIISSIDASIDALKTDTISVGNVLDMYAKCTEMLSMITEIKKNHVGVVVDIEKEMSIITLDNVPPLLEVYLHTPYDGKALMATFVGFEKKPIPSKVNLPPVIMGSIYGHWNGLILKMILENMVVFKKMFKDHESLKVRIPYCIALYKTTADEKFTFGIRECFTSTRPMKTGMLPSMMQAHKREPMCLYDAIVELFKTYNIEVSESFDSSDFRYFHMIITHNKRNTST